MGLFEAFRHTGGFARYSSNRSAVTVDKDFVCVIYVCVLVFLASILAAFGSRGKRWTTVIRVAYSVIICSVILICLYGHGWQEGEVTAKTMYLFRSMEKMDATIGLKMSLVNVNITLTGRYGNNTRDVKYNERLAWFNVDNVEHEFHEKLEQGLPAPIMTVAEYISIDVGGFRWGRYFREAGYFSYILLWASFAFWIVTIILMCSVVFFGSVMFTISGLTMCITVLVYHLLQPIYPFMIPFDKHILRLQYGWCFWLLFATGIQTTISGIIIIVFTYIKPKGTATFFGFENEFPDANDNSHNLTQTIDTIDVNKVNESFLSPSGYSNPCYTGNGDLKQSKEKWSSLPELNANLSNLKSDRVLASESRNLSSVDRKLLHSRIVCVSIPDNVELYPSRGSFQLPIEEASQSHQQIVPSLEVNKVAELSTQL